MGILLKSQYTIKNSTSEENLAKTNTPNIPYIGPYIDTIFGKKYVGDSIMNKGVQLVPLSYPKKQKSGEKFFPYDRLKPLLAENADKRDPIVGKNLPQKNDYNKGTFFRYFYIDLRTRIIIEVNNEEYNNDGLIDTMIFQKISIKWNLKSLSNQNNTTVKNLKKLGSIKISPYDYVEEVHSVDH